MFLGLPVERDETGIVNSAVCFASNSNIFLAYLRIKVSILSALRTNVILQLLKFAVLICAVGSTNTGKDLQEMDPKCFAL